MKQKLTRLVSLLCLVATLATCLVIVPMTVSAVTEGTISKSYKDTVSAKPSTEYITLFNGVMYSIPTAAYAPLESGTYSLADLFGKEGAYAEGETTYYDKYFKQFETSAFANGLENTEAEGFGAAYEAAITALTTQYTGIKALGSSSKLYDNSIGSSSVSTINPTSIAKNQGARFYEKGVGILIEFDYYCDPSWYSFTTQGTTAFRINNSTVLKFDGSHRLIAQGVFDGGTSVQLTQVGWNRISLFLNEETAVNVSGEGDDKTYSLGETTLTMKIYVNGVEKAEWSSSTPNSHRMYLDPVVDAETGVLTASYGGWSEGLHLLVTGSYRTNDNHLRMTRLGNFDWAWGTVEDVLTVKPLSYSLEDGLSLPTEQIRPSDEQFFPSENYFLVPWTDSKKGVAFTCYTDEVKNYYDTSETLTLPTPTGTTAFGNGFAGWVDSEGNSVTSVASMPADGKIYAIFDEGDYTLTISNKGETTSGKPSGNAFTLGDESAYWLFGGEVYAAGETITLTADATVYALAPTMLSGASVRTEEHSSGLRFETVIDRGLLDALEGDFAIGTLIIPTDLLGSTAFTVEALDAAGKDYLAVEADLVNDDVPPGFLESAEGATFRAAIVNIQAQNYTRRFSAISYIKYDGAYYYSEYSAADHSRSVYEVAVQSDKKNPTASYADVVRGFINGVVEIKDGAQVAPYAGYTHPLSVSIADGVLTISGAELTEGALKTVLLDGIAYTGGWRFEGGSFKATLPEN